MILTNTNVGDFPGLGWFPGDSITLTILAGIAVLLGFYFGVKFTHKKAKHKRDQKGSIKLYTVKDMQSKGIVKKISKDDIVEMENEREKYYRDHRFTKAADRLEKRFTPKVKKSKTEKNK